MYVCNTKQFITFALAGKVVVSVILIIRLLSILNPLPFLKNVFRDQAFQATTGVIVEKTCRLLYSCLPTVKSGENANHPERGKCHHPTVSI